jgi:hypothetical protein
MYRDIWALFGEHTLECGPIADVKRQPAWPGDVRMCRKEARSHIPAGLERLAGKFGAKVAGATSDQ